LGISKGVDNPAKLLSKDEAQGSQPILPGCQSLLKSQTHWR
jgi:hypothetical protein